MPFVHWYHRWLVVAIGLAALVPAALPALCFEQDAGASRRLHHEAEIDAFATIMAVTRTAFERCPGVSIDETVVAAAKDRLHVVDADYFAFRAKAHRLAEDLERDVGSIGVNLRWCQDSLRRYGPAGTDLRGALRQ